MSRPQDELGRGSESVALSVVSASKMPYFADESSTTPALPDRHFLNTVADVFADSAGECCTDRVREINFDAPISLVAYDGF